ncbi:hypothetical protein MNBD_NITROSPINAE03-1885 [hydrothermal vent metagenome]|uniref:Cytochrome c domain-containing protein n=1 Tax=hydrothermal vent metagenome TaxID=652676 RepID=A0A3B1BUR9_9ZZZZ
MSKHLMELYKSISFLLFSVFIVAVLFSSAFSEDKQSGESKFDDLIHNMRPMEKWLAGFSLPVNISEPWPPLDEASLKVGRTIYQARCAVCHGVKGDGKGPRAGDMKIKPRDFTEAKYKFRSTPAGALPTDADLFKTISRGLHGTAMVPWLGLNNSQKWLVIYYIKTFSDYFEDGEKAEVITPPEPVKSSDEYVKLGAKVYDKAKCHECHGKEGYGDGMKADKLKDDWLRPIKPMNFRKRILKRGLEINEIYLTIATGLNGTPMASYASFLTEDEILAASYFIRSLAPDMETRVTVHRQRPAPDALAGLRIDHMQGIRFRGPLMFPLR